MKQFVRLLLVICIGLALLPTMPTQAQDGITTDAIINAYNSMRVANGYAPLIVDPILMQTAQETADIMALYHMTDHIGNIRGRVMAAGYGYGDTAWATENWAMGMGSLTLSSLLAAWADESHMIPAVNPYYKHVGAGIAEYDGRVYYILHAAYTSDGTYQTTPVSPNVTPDPSLLATAYVSQIIYPVQTSTPNPGSPWLHEVRAGQSLWSIAIAYDTHIAILQQINGMPESDTTIYMGQKLYMPTPQLPPDVIAQTATAVVNQASTPDPGQTPIQQVAVGTEKTPTVNSSPTAVRKSPTATRISPTRTPTPTIELSTTVPEEPVKQPLSGKNIIGIILIAAAGLGLLLIILGAVLKK